MDRSGRIQCYASKDLMGEEAYKHFKKFDIGDIVGVHGKLFRTKTDELTLACDQVTLLTKSFRSLPEKHKGLTNVEIRYRQRYVDLITNPKVRDIFRKRSKIIRTFRAFLEERGFVEVETPMLHPVAGGAAARPFITHHNALDMDTVSCASRPSCTSSASSWAALERVYELEPQLPQRGHRHPSQPRVHHRASSTRAYATDYHGHDGPDRGHWYSTVCHGRFCGSTERHLSGRRRLDLTPRQAGSASRCHESLARSTAGTPPTSTATVAGRGTRRRPRRGQGSSRSDKGHGRAAAT